MKDHNCITEESFHIFPIQIVIASNTPVVATDESSNASNVLTTDYETMWVVEGKGNYLILEPDYITNNSKNKKINQIHISFNKGFEKKYNFIIQTSNNDNDVNNDNYNNVTFTSITSQLTSSGQTDALEAYILPHEVDNQFIRIIFNGNNIDDWNIVHTIRLVYDDLQEQGSSYIPNI